MTVKAATSTHRVGSLTGWIIALQIKQLLLPAFEVVGFSGSSAPPFCYSILQHYVSALLLLCVPVAGTGGCIRLAFYVIALLLKYFL